MKKIFYFTILFLLFLNNTFAEKGDGGILGVNEQKIRNGDFTYEDIPNIIVNATNFFIAIAGTISVLFIIIGAYKYLFGSLDGNTDRGKNTIFMALIGFTISVCSYLIIKLVIDNFAG